MQIHVVLINESYTSGTGYLDGEKPDEAHYDKKRRIHRGLFRSCTGEQINADVNAAYQIIAKGGYKIGKTRKGESIRKIKVS